MAVIATACSAPNDDIGASEAAFTDCSRRANGPNFTTGDGAKIWVCQDEAHAGTYYVDCGNGKRGTTQSFANWDVGNFCDEAPRDACHWVGDRYASPVYVACQCGDLPYRSTCYGTHLGDQGFMSCYNDAERKCQRYLSSSAPPPDPKPAKPAWYDLPVRDAAGANRTPLSCAAVCASVSSTCVPGCDADKSNLAGQAYYVSPPEELFSPVTDWRDFTSCAAVPPAEYDVNVDTHLVFATQSCCCKKKN